MQEISNNFCFYLPFEIMKSEKDDNGQTKMIIGGYASTAEKDRQDDIIVQEGIDFSDFLDFGYINYNHDNSIICGFPIKEDCKVDSKGFYIKAQLLDGVPEAESMYNASLALQRANAPRRLGFSVEGKIVSRDNRGRVTKCKICNVAITNSPVNTNCTWEALAKSMTAGLSDWDKQCNIEAPANNDPIVDTNPIIKESLDKKLTDEGFAGGSNGDTYTTLKSVSWFNELSDIIDSERLEELSAIIQSGTENLTDAQMTLYLQLTRGISRDNAENIVRLLHLNVAGQQS